MILHVGDKIGTYTVKATEPGQVVSHDRGRKETRDTRAQAMKLISTRTVQVVLLAAAAMSPLGAQRPGRRQQQPTRDTTSPPPTKLTDTSLVRKTPDGFVLDFQEQELRVVLEAIAEAGGLNVTFANLPATKVTLRMGQKVTKAEALDVLRGVAGDQRPQNDGRSVADSHRGSARANAATAPAAGHAAGAVEAVHLPAQARERGYALRRC